MYKPNPLTHHRLFGSATVLVVVGMLSAACGSTAAPPSGAPVSTPTQAAVEGSLSVGPVTTALPEIDMAADPNLALQASEDSERERARAQSGLAQEFGSGWEALSTAVDQATDAAAESLAAEFAVTIPITRRHALFASIGAPDLPVSATPASAAAALALLGSALTASSSLGLPGTMQPTVSQSSTTTSGDSTATVTVNGQGVAMSSGSRVWATFTFDLSGTVTNNNTGATATMTGSASSRIEIDACPDVSGHSKGKVSLSSRESASNGVGWTRDLTGDFDITVDDEANISNVAVDAQARESVAPNTREGQESDGHDLGIRTHVEFGVERSFAGMTHNDAALTLEVTDEENATTEDLLPLFTSALTAVTAGAHILGSAAEKFWQDGKCIEVIVAPAGEDVDPDSTTEVTVKVKHRIEGNELNKPVEANLAGVKSIEPAGVKKPAPATFTYTAGPADGDKGDVEFKSVSNRGIGKKTVTFTVRAIGWMFHESTPLGDFDGAKCDGQGGDWTITGLQNVGPLKVTSLIVVSINIATLEGTFDFHKDQVGLGTVTTHQSNGAARIVLNEDGSVTMTLDAATIYLHTTNSFGGSGSATIQGDTLIYPWTPATPEACPGG